MVFANMVLLDDEKQVSLTRGLQKTAQLILSLLCGLLTLKYYLSPYELTRINLGHLESENAKHIQTT